MTFEQFISEWNDNNDFITAFTSGSTGTPKELKLSKQFVTESAKRTIAFFGLTNTSRFHSCVSPDFIGGKMMAVRAEIVKGSLTWEKPSNEPLKEIGRHEVIDLLAVVPSQMISIIDKPESLPEIRNIIIGGSAIHPDLRKKIADSGLMAYETYGMTETASHIALRRVYRDELPFKVFKGINIDVDDENCLVIEYGNGMRIQTNDIAEIVSESEFLIRGRRDNIINSGGKKINPFQLEEKISPLIHNDFYITGEADEKWGESVVLIIEGEKSAINLDFLQLEIAKILEPWQRPKRIIIKKELPRTPNGKILRNHICL